MILGVGSPIILVDKLLLIVVPIACASPTSLSVMVIQLLIQIRIHF